MKKLFTYLAFGALLLTGTNGYAQTNLVAGDNVNIHILGDANIWTALNGETYTFETETLSRLKDTSNRDWVFLFPEGQNGGGFVANENTNATQNKETGIQVFYVDLGSSQEIGTVVTTWQGAAANSFNIFLTDAEPTTSILTDSDPTFKISGAGQYEENTASLPANSKGRYLVFQVTDPTNWGWGVKMGSIAAYAPVDDELTTFTVAPSIVILNRETSMTMTALNQLGVVIPSEEVEIEVSDNAEYSGGLNGTLIVKSGSTATVSAIHNEITKDVTIYAADIPTPPVAANIKVPVYTNTVTTNNSTAEFVTEYNGGATSLGELAFDNGMVTQQFNNVQCIFFSNSATTGAWNSANNILNPEEAGLQNLCISIFPSKSVDCNIFFEAAIASGSDTGKDVSESFSLTAGQWNNLTVDVSSYTQIKNYSLRMTADNATDLLLANIYFTGAASEGTAPTLGDVTVSNITASGATLSFSATLDDSTTDAATVAEDDTQITYTVTNGVDSHTTTGKSGEEATVTLTGLKFSTDYVYTVSAQVGEGPVSNVQTVNFTTTSIPTDNNDLAAEEDYCIAIYSTGLNFTENISFVGSDDNTPNMSYLTTSGDKQVLLFNGFTESNTGTITDINYDVTNAKGFNIDIYSQTAGTIVLKGIWSYNGETSENPNTYKIEITDTELNTWKNFQPTAVQMGYGTSPADNNNEITTISALVFSESTIPTFAVDNLYFFGTEALAVDTVDSDNNGLVNVYNLQGICVKSNVAAADALNGLPKGLYIVGGKKMIVR